MTFIRWALCTRPDHFLPAIFWIVDHAAAIAEKRHTLIYQSLSRVLANRQMLEAPPRTRLQESVAQCDRAGLLELDRKSPGLVRCVRREIEIESLPVASLELQGFFGIHHRAIPAFQSDKYFRWRFGPSPKITFVVFAFHKIHAPAIKALVFDSDHTRTAGKSDLLALIAGKCPVRFKGKTSLDRALPDRTPHAAHAVRRAVASIIFKRDLFL